MKMANASNPNAQDYRRRRDQLMMRYPDAVFVIPSEHLKVRNHTVHYPFRQDSDFYYLTGIEEPEAVLVIRRVGRRSQSTLFLRERPGPDSRLTLWEGALPGHKDVLKDSGVERAFLRRKLVERLPQLLSGTKTLYYRPGVDPALDLLVRDSGHPGRRQTWTSSLDPRAAIGELRIRKDFKEIALLRKAAEISAMSHLEAMRAAKSGMREYEVAALLEAGFKRRGALRTAYEPIVAAGSNALTLHYTRCESRLEKGCLLLVDAAGEYQYYASDITRTYPVGRRFSRKQAEAYQVVLDAQKAAIDQARPGAILESVHRAAADVISDYARHLGMKAGSLYPHATSHWLGLDVHDSGSYEQEDGAPRVLEPGMVFTIEPGMYFRESGARCPDGLFGTGIRIEDDVLITKSGNEVLTSILPKEIEEIEEIRGHAG